MKPLLARHPIIGLMLGLMGGLMVAGGIVWAAATFQATDPDKVKVAELEEDEDRPAGSLSFLDTVAPGSGYGTTAMTITETDANVTRGVRFRVDVTGKLSEAGQVQVWLVDEDDTTKFCGPTTDLPTGTGAPTLPRSGDPDALASCPTDSQLEVDVPAGTAATGTSAADVNLIFVGDTDWTGDRGLIAFVKWETPTA